MAKDKIDWDLKDIAWLKVKINKNDVEGVKCLVTKYNNILPKKLHSNELDADYDVVNYIKKIYFNLNYDKMLEYIYDIINQNNQNDINEGYNGEKYGSLSYLECANQEVHSISTLSIGKQREKQCAIELIGEQPDNE